jgi:hypothetical protein
MHVWRAGFDGEVTAKMLALCGEKDARGCQVPPVTAMRRYGRPPQEVKNLPAARPRWGRRRFLHAKIFLEATPALLDQMGGACSSGIRPVTGMR